MLSGSTGATLDPVCVLQAEIAMKPYETAQIVFMTAVAGSRREVLQLVYRYRRWSQVRRAIDEARFHTEHEILQLEIDSRDIERFEKLLSPLLFTTPLCAQTRVSWPRIRWDNLDFGHSESPATIHSC